MSLRRHVLNRLWSRIMAKGFYFLLRCWREKPCWECSMAKSPFSFKILFSFYFLERKKKSKSKFWSDGIFGLGRFSIYWVLGLQVSFFWQEALKRWSPCSLIWKSSTWAYLKPVGFFENPLVGRHVLINLKLIYMA